MSRTLTLAITERALFQRVQRKLKHDGERLRTNRSARWENDLGYHYIIDTDRNSVVAAHVDIEALGRELGVLAPEETVRAAG